MLQKRSDWAGSATKQDKRAQKIEEMERVIKIAISRLKEHADLFNSLKTKLFC